MRSQTFDRFGNLVSEVFWTKLSLKDHLSVVRHDRETMGIVVDGIPISTERGDHRIVMQNLMIQASSDPSFAIRLKTQDGFVSLDSTSILRVCAAMLTYIAQCFDREDELSQQIDEATTPQQLDEIAESLDQSWPTREFSQ